MCWASVCLHSRHFWWCIAITGIFSGIIFTMAMPYIVKSHWWGSFKTVWPTHLIQHYMWLIFLKLKNPRIQLIVFWCCGMCVSCKSLSWRCAVGPHGYWGFCTKCCSALVSTPLCVGVPCLKFWLDDRLSWQIFYGWLTPSTDFRLQNLKKLL